MLLFIGGVTSIFYRAYVLYSLNSLFSLVLCCICLLSTLCLSCLCQYMTKRERRNRWNLGILFKKVFNCLYGMGNEIFFWKRRKYFFWCRGRVSFHVCYLLLLYIFFIIYLSLFPHMHWCALLSVSRKTGTFWSRHSASYCNF